MTSQARSVPRSIACLLIPQFPLRVEILRHPDLDGAPVALVDLSTHRRAVTDCSAEAAARGVRAGMLVREAVGLCPELVMLPADPVYVSDAFADVIQALSRVSPVIEPDEPGCIFIDLQGLVRLFGNLDALARALLRAVPTLLRPRLGIAPAKFTACLAAQAARPGNWRLVSAAADRAFLAPWPVDVLPVSPVIRERLRQLGLCRLGDLARLPRGALQAQFGPDGRRAWDLAHGLDREPLVPRPPAETLVERLTLPAPTVELEPLRVGLRHLTGRLFTRPALQGRGVRQARLQLVLEGSQSWERTITLTEPAVEPARLATILADSLERAVLAAPVAMLVVAVTGWTTATGRQERLPGMRPRHQRAALAEAIRSLTQRYGSSPLYYVVEVEPWSRIPERRHALLPCDSSTLPVH